MLDSLFVGMTGLTGYSKGLRVISNNVANLNTPGFKGSQQQFSDLFYQGGAGGSASSNGGFPQYGTGLNALATTLNLKAGETRQTGGALDVSITGDGFFVLKDKNSGDTRYTRAGQLQFDQEGFLTGQDTAQHVMGFAESGALVDISLTGLRANAAKATANVVLQGNLSSTLTTSTLDNVKVIDSAGAEHLLKLVFKRTTAADKDWSVDVMDGATTLTTGTVSFADGKVVTGKDSVAFSFTPTGAAAMNVTVKLGADVTSFASGSSSSLAVASQDGIASGTLTNATFDVDGKLKLTYSNGQTVEGPQLALARFDSSEAIESAGGNQFIARNASLAHLGRANAGGLGKITAGQLELSNVDLSVEFSDLIVMQRGYQAASRIVSTADEMLKELFDMKGHG
jgi:flagellar hook protein FlgE